MLAGVLGHRDVKLMAGLERQAREFRDIVDAAELCAAIWPPRNEQGHKINQEPWYAIVELRLFADNKNNPPRFWARRTRNRPKQGQALCRHP